ncbi:hypothetical protein B9J75_02845 [Leuconostoc citreum]|uniref:ribonuclease H1 domain-containing protein n=1 Tax=Leuconostoc citreum TaxID=33964 RepID=UPI000A1E76FD|nr:ribonuclease H family protein [Leuconostoc citreum]OSP82411.1 hypothetical protein B9J75_02845 [Leuconostoc citreum]
MAKKKFYAVREGKQTGIFHSWPETQAAVDGFSNPVFKGFVTEQEALTFLNDEQNASSTQAVMETQDVTDDKDYDLIAYVDGSKLGEKEGYGIGVVLLDNDQNIINTYSKLGSDPIYLQSRQVAGEVEAVLYALSFASESGYHKIKIYYDYEGIQKWAEKIWKRNTPVASHYLHSFDTLVEDGDLTVHFEKVKAHTGIKYNEKADQLAKQAFSENTHVKHSDGSHLFQGIHSRDDLTTLINIINESDSGLRATLERKTEHSITYLFSTNSSHATGTYNDNTMKLFLQGKSDSDALLQAVSYSVSLLPSAGDVLKVMTAFTDRNLDKNIIADVHKQLLPNYSDGFEETVYENMIYQSFANYLDETEAFDYTYKITPLFRLSEHMLVDAFESINKLDDLKGSDHHTHFGNVVIGNSKEEKENGALSHRLKESYVDEFGSEKANIVLNLYIFYNATRSPYSHGDQVGNDTKIVNSNTEVKEIITDTLRVFNSYYSHFS